jgi:hypothetical protein
MVRCVPDQRIGTQLSFGGTIKANPGTGDQRMKWNLLGLLITGVFAGPLAANAQVTTLDYLGSANGIVLTYDGHDPPTTSPFTGTFTAEVVVDGSVAANDLTIASYNVSGPVSISGSSLGNQGGLIWFLAGGEMSLTASNGALTGATFQYRISPGNGAGDASFSITQNGDSFSVGHFSPGTGVGTQTYGGGSGVWTATTAPEMDPGSSATGLTLLLGSIVLLRARRGRGASMVALNAQVN